MRTSCFTVHDLLISSGLSLSLVAGGPDHTDAEILGVVAWEAGDVRTAMAENWVVVSTGVNLATEHAQRTLLRELAEAGCSALVFALDSATSHNSMPAVMIEEAEKVGVAVLQLSSAREICALTKYVWKQVQSLNGSAAVKVAAIDRLLMSAFADSAPELALVRRLSQVLDCETTLMRDGQYRTGNDRIPADEILAVARGPHEIARFELEDWHGVVLRLGTVDEDDVVIFSRPRRSPLPELLESVAISSGPLFKMADRLVTVEVSQQAAAARGALDTLLVTTDAVEAETAMRRLAQLGFDRSEYAVALAASDDLELSVRAVNFSYEPNVATVHAGAVVILMFGSPTDDVLAHRMRAWDLKTLMVGRTVTDPSEIIRSWTDASVMQRTGASLGGVARYDDLSLPDLLLAELPLDRIGARVQQWLGPLTEQPLYLDTVLAYLESDYSVNSTATALGIHANSVRYRLRRAEELLGSDLRKPSALLAVYVAMGQRRAEKSRSWQSARRSARPSTLARVAG